MTGLRPKRTFIMSVLTLLVIYGVLWMMTYRSDVMTYHAGYLEMIRNLPMTCSKNVTYSGDVTPVTMTTPNDSRSSTYPIPNIVHYVWFTYKKKPKKFAFHHFISVLSAYKRLKPDVIYVHCDVIPGGEHWDMMTSLPTVKVVHRDPPRKIFGAEIKAPVYETSDSNVARLMVVMETGGIYLDTDVIVVREMEELRKHQCVLGLEDNYKVCAGVIMAAPKAPFLYLWINSFIDDYKIGMWLITLGMCRLN